MESGWNMDREQINCKGISMTKKEFLLELQRILNGRMGSGEAAPYVSYYQEYIEIEVRKGKMEEKVIEELGSPRLIAKNVADVFDRKNQKTTPGRRALRYGEKMLLYGEALGKKCLELCVSAAQQAKAWFDGLR